jgi:acetyltransferase-like isoleucine patch superfamily enzyme
MLYLTRKFLRERLMAVKSSIKLNFVYPERFAASSVKSVLPAGIENLIKEDVKIERHVTISEHLKELGKGVYIGWNTEITQCREIGPFSSISNGVKIGLNSHPLEHVGTNAIFFAKRRGWIPVDTYNENAENFVEIGADALISANVIILKGVKIGVGAVVGAGAVVTKDVPPYAIVAGVPAKIIRYRFNEAMISRLLKSEWWNMPSDKLKSRAHLFHKTDEFLKEIGY